MLLDDDYGDDRPNPNLTDWEVFTKIWFKPKMVFEFIHSKEYSKYMMLIIVLSGICSIIDGFAEKGFGSGSYFVGELIALIVIGGILGWVGALIYSALLSWTGRWLGGKSSSTPIYSVVTYSNIPSAAGLVLWIILPILFDSGLAELFSLQHEGLIRTISFFGASVIQLILGVWTLVIFIIGLSGIQRFSIGKAILNTFLPVVLLVVPYVLLSLLFTSNS